MAETRLDPRVWRTLTRLRDTVRDVLEEGVAVDRLTVADLARRADVHRATVYQHYADLDALVADALAEEVRRVLTAMAGCPFEAPDPGTPRALSELFAHVAAHRAVYSHVLGRGASSTRLTDAVAAALADRFDRFDRGERPPAAGSVPARLRAEFLAGGLVRALASVTTSDADAGSLASATWALVRGASR